MEEEEEGRFSDSGRVNGLLLEMYSLVYCLFRLVYGLLRRRIVH